MDLKNFWIIVKIENNNTEYLASVEYNGYGESFSYYSWSEYSYNANLFTNEKDALYVVLKQIKNYEAFVDIRIISYTPQKVFWTSEEYFSVCKEEEKRKLVNELNEIQRKLNKF